MHELGELHGVIISILALVILYSDHQGYLYFRGKKETLSLRFITWSHRIVWAGLLAMIGTGLILFSQSAEYFLVEPIFLLKMGFVATLVINGFLIGSLSAVAATTPYNALDKATQRKLFISGILSSIGWIGAATIGLFFL